MPKTIAVDFDGVIHYWPHGYDNITIRGITIPGAIQAITELQKTYAVAIMTARDVRAVAWWLHTTHGLATYPDTEMTHTIWQDQQTLLVTNRKIVASVYIDDRAVRFSYWEKTLAEVKERLTWPKSSSPPKSSTTKPTSSSMTSSQPYDAEPTNT